MRALPRHVERRRRQRLPAVRPRRARGAGRGGVRGVQIHGARGSGEGLVRGQMWSGGNRGVGKEVVCKVPSKSVRN